MCQIETQYLYNVIVNFPPLNLERNTPGKKNYTGYAHDARNTVTDLRGKHKRMLFHVFQEVEYYTDH